MIPFSEIDSRLKAIGKDRRWLAKESGRSWNSIRNALAPKAPESQRSKFLNESLSLVIEREERRQSEKTGDTPEPVNQIVLQAGADRFNAWNHAAVAKGATIAEWAGATLDSAAGHRPV